MKNNNPIIVTYEEIQRHEELRKQQEQWLYENNFGFGDNPLFKNLHQDNLPEENIEPKELF